MKKTSSKPSIYPELVASFIEADAGTVEAIAFQTKEELKKLKDSHERKKRGEAIISQARKSEMRILSILPLSP